VASSIQMQKSSLPKEHRWRNFSNIRQARISTHLSRTCSGTPRMAEARRTSPCKTQGQGQLNHPKRHLHHHPAHARPTVACHGHSTGSCFSRPIILSSSKRLSGSSHHPRNKHGIILQLHHLQPSCRFSGHVQEVGFVVDRCSR